MTRPADLWPDAGPSSQVVGRRDRIPSTWNVARRYAVIVDAGSSGSRMQIYSWKDPRVDRTQRERQGDNVKVLPTVEKGTWDGSGQDWQLKVEPGLSSFGSHPQDLGDYLKPLFDHARSVIPPQLLAETPVYVLATAGMRLLPEDKRKAVVEQTCSYIQSQTPFQLGVGGCADHVQVISGEEEGLLGWIAINYLMDGFHFRPTIGEAEGTIGKSTFGFLDMGGASTQIAFEPSLQAQDISPDRHDDMTQVALRMLDGTDVVHNVFVTTFLGFGTNKARERYLDVLLPSSATTSTTDVLHPIADPCLPKGLTQTTQDRLPVVGTGSFEHCLKSLAPLLDKDAACTRPPCLFHGVHVPPIDFSMNHFIGVSEYWFSSNDVFQLGGVYDFVSFQKAAQAYCGTSWDHLKTQLNGGTVFGKSVTEDRLEMQCFKAAWMATVLHEGIGLPRLTDPGGKGDGKVHADEAQGKADEKNLFQSVNDVGGLSVSWTLGKAVLEASKDIPPLPANGPHSAPVHGETPIVPQKDGKWQDKFIPAWQRPSQALLSGRHRALPGAAVLAVIVVTLLCFMSCFFLRGRNPKAIKRRAILRDFVKSPCSRRRATHGDYTLANMEEGGHRGGADGDVALGSDTSGDEDGMSPKSKHKRRRSSGNSLVAALIVPLQRLGLALGIKRSVAPHPPISLGPRRQLPPRYPMRHHAVATPVSMSQPTSPKPYSAHIANSMAAGSLSRPASRSGSVLSPRIMHQSDPTGNSYFGAWQQSSNGGGQFPGSSLGSATATATASARSSRAGSPVFGHAANGGSHHHHHATANGRLNPSRNSTTPGFSRKAWEDSD